MKQLLFILILSLSGGECACPLSIEHTEYSFCSQSVYLGDFNADEKEDVNDLLAFLRVHGTCD